MINKILLTLLCSVIYLVSCGIIINRCEKKNVPDSCLIVLLTLCPVVNTLLAIYFTVKFDNCKESFKTLFSND